MPVSITSTPKPSTSSPSASTSTSSKSTSALSPPTRKRPTPTDHIFNYTYTYGYNFGYISNGLALLEDRRSLLEEALKKGTGASVLPLTTTTAPLEATTERTTSTTTSTTSRKESSTSSTTLSLTFSAASPVTSSAHPFSPYYRKYIELVSSGALNDGSKKARASTSVSPTNTNANNKTKQQVVVPLSLANLNSLEKKKRKREVESPDMKDLIDREREVEAEMDYFSLPTRSSTTAKRARMDIDTPVVAVTSPTAPPSTTETTLTAGTTSSQTPFLLPGLDPSSTSGSTSSTLSNPSSVLCTPGSTIGSGMVSRTISLSPFADPDERNISLTFPRRTPSPCGSEGGAAQFAYGGMGSPSAVGMVGSVGRGSPSPSSSSLAGIGGVGVGGAGMSVDYFDRPRTPGVFTSSGGIGQGSGRCKSRSRGVGGAGAGVSGASGGGVVHKREGSAGVGVGVGSLNPNPRPRGLWRARGTGPAPPGGTVNVDVKGKGKASATTTTSRSLTPSISTKTTSTSTPTALEKTVTTTTRRGRGDREGGGHESCSSSESDMSECDYKNLKRRRVRRGRSRGRGGGEDVYSESGSESGWSSCSSAGESDVDCGDDGMYRSRRAEGQNERKRQRRGVERRRMVVGGGSEDQLLSHHGRRHQDHAESADQPQRQAQHMQSRTTLHSSVASLKQATTTVDAMSSIAADTAPDSSAQSDTATLAALASSTKAIPVLDDLSDARKYFTRSKVMDTTSLARTRFSDSPQPVGSVTYEDWEDLKEVWARCLEVVDVEDPSETLPLLRGIIHECSRFLQAYDDPSVLFLAPHAVAQNGTPDKSTDPLFGTTKVDAGVGSSEPSPNAAPTIRASTSSTSATHHHSKDLPTAFHSLLGTALFFFGNIIDANPHLALEGEPRTQAFYHLYTLDVFEMAERLPARTGSGGIYTGYQEDNDFTGTYSFTSDIIAQAQAAAAAHNDCCGLGAKEDWRMAITWGRTLVSLAEELLEREKLVEELFKPEEVKMAQRPPEDQESYFAYASYGRPPPPPPKAPNPASFLAEDFIMNSGMLGDGYFGGTGGRAMGFNVDGMGGLRVNGSSFMRGVNQPVSLPSAIFPLDEAIPRTNCSSMPSATPGVSSPFASVSLGGVNSSMSPGTSSSSLGSSTLSTVSGRRSRQSPYLPQTPLDDPRKHWKKDSPFMVIRSRMAPVTRRMTLGGGDVNGMPATPELAKYGIDPYDHSSAASGFTLSWWNDDEDEGNGRYPVDSKKRRDDAKKKERKRQGATVDEIMTMAVDQFSRGVLHMPRTGSSGLTGQHSNGAEGGSRRHRHKHHGHKHRHHHGHHHRHHRHGKHAEPLPHPLDGGDQLPQGFSRASHLLTIAIEVLMLAEKLPCAESRYRWASYADNVFAQMRLEESPGTNIVMLNGERMDVDGEPRSHPGSRSGSRTRRAHKSKSRARKDHGDGPSSLSFPLHPLAVHDVSTNPGLFLDSNNNDVILKARGRCALIIGSAVAEERIETFLEEFDEQEDGDEDGDGTPTNSDERQHRESKEERLQKLLKSEDAEEARGRLREAVELLEKARGIWREGVEVRRRERERVKGDVEREKKAREVRNVNGKIPNVDTAAATTSPKLGEEERKKVVVKGKGRTNGVSSPDRAPPKRRGIAALAAENKKKRKEKERERDAMMVVVDESHDQMDVDVEMGDVSFESQSQPQPHQSTPSLSPPVTSINSNSTTSSQDVEVLSKEEESALKACEMSMEEEDQRLLASFAAEEEEEEEEEREYAKLIAEALVTLANILVVEDGVGVGGDAGDAHARGHGMSEAEMEREELYRKAKEEMRRGGVVEVEGMI